MSKWTQTLLAAVITGMAFAASAQQAADHTQHHPSTATAPSPAPTATQQFAPQAGMPMGMSSMPQMQEHMQQHMTTMQALRAKMAAAKTPAERQALMAEHMKAMQEGMDMMKGMNAMGGMPGMGAGARSADPAQHQRTMEMRMDMMQTMMEMMMQRMPVSAPN